MEKFLIFVVFVSTVIGWILTVIDGDKDDRISSLSVIGGFLCIVIPTACFILFDGSPSAMDVYQGKTILEVTYRDGVAVDSVVVFKEKRNNYGKMVFTKRLCFE